MSEPTADIYTALAAEWPVNETHTLPANMGTDLTYITGEQAITRLNTVLGFNEWTFEIREHGIHNGIAWVLGRFEIPSQGVVREQFGAQKLRSTPSGDEMKSAATDCLKKCAMSVGVGLYLSHKETIAEAQAARQQARQENVQRQAPVTALPRPISQPPACADCKQAITPTGRFTVESIVNTGVSKYGRALCLACGKKAQEEARLTEQEVREDLKQAEMQAAG